MSKRMAKPGDIWAYSGNDGETDYYLVMEDTIEKETRRRLYTLMYLNGNTTRSGQKVISGYSYPIPGGSWCWRFIG